MLDYVSCLHFSISCRLTLDSLIGERSYGVRSFSPNPLHVFVAELRSHFCLSSKLSLYTSLHNSIAAHHSVLSAREEELNNARENLIREGGNVVGGSNVVGLREPERRADEPVKEG